MQFHNEIVVHPLPDGKHWETKDWFAVEITLGLIYIITDFVFDFASIPRILWPILGSPATGKHRRAALVHDWIYSTQQITRIEADQIMLLIMEEDGVNKIKRHLVYYGVRIGGWVAWGNKGKAANKKILIGLQKTQLACNPKMETLEVYA